MFRIQKKNCNQRLFTKNKIVSNKRKQQIISDCIKNDTHFICHKEQNSEGLGLCCRGFFDNYKTKSIHMAIMLRVTEFVEVR